MPNAIVSLIVIFVVLLMLGIAYAIYIALRPFRPGLTWLSVVIGDTVTDLGMSAFLWAIGRCLIGITDWRCTCSAPSPGCATP
jgi:hypothetical protein